MDFASQGIADSWPRALDDSVARHEWGWYPQFSLRDLVDDMYENLTKKLSRS